MRVKITTSLLALIILASFSSVNAQSRQDRKLKRAVKKMERQMEKVQELSKGRYSKFQDQFDHLRSRDIYREYQEQALREAGRARIWADNYRGRWSEEEWAPFVENWQRDGQKYQKAIQIQQEALEKAMHERQSAIEKARQYQKQALEEALMGRQESVEKMRAEKDEMIEQLRMELEKARQELKKEREVEK